MRQERGERLGLGRRIHVPAQTKKRPGRTWFDLNSRPDLHGLPRRINGRRSVVCRTLDEKWENAGADVEAAGRLVDEVGGVDSK